MADLNSKAIRETANHIFLTLEEVTLQEAVAAVVVALNERFTAETLYVATVTLKPVASCLEEQQKQ